MMEFYESTVSVAGLRNCAEEVGVYQQEPAVVYQDNESTIKIINNRGSLGQTSRAIGLKYLTARNRVEDHQVQTKYCPTPLMVADYGTKALPEAIFVRHRDVANGYALVKAAYPDKQLPDYVYGGEVVDILSNLTCLQMDIMESAWVASKDFDESL